MECSSIISVYLYLMINTGIGRIKYLFRMSEITDNLEILGSILRKQRTAFKTETKRIVVKRTDTSAPSSKEQ